MSRKSAILPSTSAAVLLSNVLPTVADYAPTPHARTRFTSFEQMEHAREEAQNQGYQVGLEKGNAVGFLEGFEEGKRLGKNEAYADANKELAKEIALFVAALQKVQQGLQEALPDWYAQSEEAMTDLAMNAVRQILAAELSISRESALGIVKEALQDVTHSKHARIRLNPFDSAILQQHRQEVLAAAGSLRDVDFVDDPTIAGGCLIETDGGVVDATVDTRIILLEQRLRESA